MATFQRIHRISQLLLTSASLLSAGSAFAQSAQPADGAAVEQGDEIVVTAQKRAEKLSSVPMAITAATGEQLVQQGVTSPSDLVKIAPSFTYQQSSYGTPVYAIRGVGFYDTSITGSPTVSIYLDEAPLPYSVMTKGISMDLAQVEVMKGPQGTLFGQNATGGAINYKAARPTDDLSAGFNVDYGRFNALNVEAYLSGPIAPGVRARIAGRHERMDEWQVAYAPNDASLGVPAGRKLGKRDFTAGRFTLEIEPSDRVLLTASANGWIDKSDTQAQRFRQFSPQSPQFSTIPIANPALSYNDAAYAALGPLTAIPRGDSRLAGWDVGDFGRDDWFYQLSLRGEFSLSDAAKVTSITSYSKYRERSASDPDGTAHQDLLNIEDGSIQSFYQELRASGEGNGFKWMIGGNYAHDKSAETQVNKIISSNAGAPTPDLSVYFPLAQTFITNRQDVKTWAIFGSFDYELTDRLTVQASARYTDQNRDFAGCNGDTGDGLTAGLVNGLFGVAGGSGFPALAGHCVTMASDVPPFTIPAIVNKQLNEDSFSWRASLNYKPNADMLVYGSVSRGYKAGSFSTVPATFAFQFDPAQQEELTSYELGFKTSFLDRKAQLSTAAFYYDYRNKQVLGGIVVFPFGYLPKLVNIPKSRALGIEADLVLRPIDGLKLRLGGVYLDTKVKANPAQGTTADLFGVPTSFIGEAFTNTPSWQGVADVEYTFDAGNLRPFVGGSIRAQSSSYAVFGRNAEARIDGYAVVDLRAGVEDADGRWRIQVYGRNVFDKYYLVNAARYLDAVTETAGMPGTYGVSVSFKY